MISFSINAELVLTLIVLTWIVRALANITLGALKTERSNNYDASNVVVGIVSLIIIFIVLLQ